MQKLPNGMVALADAARMACLEVGLSGAISDDHLNRLALRLWNLVTIYSVAEEGGQAATVRALSAEDTQGGVFSNGAQAITFGDGRPPISGLAVTDVSLHAALMALKAARDQ